MKRSEALTPLSHDHHQALVLAQRLRRADAGNAPEVRDAFLGFWREHGQRHFREEEELLLPAYAGHGDAHHPLVLRALGEQSSFGSGRPHSRPPEPRTRRRCTISASGSQPTFAWRSASSSR